MKSKSIIAKATKIANKKLKIESIEISNKKSFRDDDSHTLSLLMFYSLNNEYSNLTATSYSWQENHGVENLLLVFKNQIDLLFVKKTNPELIEFDN